MGGGHVICPLHAHQFNLENGAGSEPGECVKVYGIKERKGEILLSLCDRRGAPPEAVAEREDVERGTREAPL